MNVSFNYPLDNALIQGKFVQDSQCPKNFGHLEVEVSGGDAIGIPDTYQAMSVINANDFAVKMLGEKTFQVAFIQKEESEKIFNDVVDLFEDIYFNN